MKKIAIVGTGPGRVNAPYNKDWEIWGIAGLFVMGQVFDRVYEVHSAQWAMDTLNKLDPDIRKTKFDWMKENVTHIHSTLKTTFPDAKVIDFECHLKKFGRYFTSTIGWMMAEAIEEKPSEIGIYGVTMSHDSEYAHQKPALAYLIGWAKAMGIKVTIDKDGELMSAPFVYGYEEVPSFITSVEDKKKSLLEAKEKAEMAVFDAKAKYHYTEGRLDEIQSFENNWWSGTRCQ